VDLKPEDTEVDLAALSATAALVGAGAVEWLSTATLPVGYGLFKLRLKGILPMCGAAGGQIEEVQDVCDMLADLDGAMSADVLDLQPCCPRSAEPSTP
jgi:translation elongation factor EF-1beta